MLRAAGLSAARETLQWSSNAIKLVGEDGAPLPADAVRERLLEQVRLQTLVVGHSHRQLDSETVQRAFDAAQRLRSAGLTLEGGDGFARHAPAILDCIIAGRGADAESVADCADEALHRSADE